MPRRCSSWTRRSRDFGPVQPAARLRYQWRHIHGRSACRREPLWRVVREGRKAMSGYMRRTRRHVGRRRLPDRALGRGRELCHEGFVSARNSASSSMTTSSVPPRDASRPPVATTTASSLAKREARWGAPGGVHCGDVGAQGATRAHSDRGTTKGISTMRARSARRQLHDVGSDTPWVALDLVESRFGQAAKETRLAHVEAMRSAGVARISPRIALLSLASSALVAPPADASSVFEAALAVPEASRWSFEYARVQCSTARSAPIEGGQGGSVDLLEAEDTFRRLGAEPWVKRAAHEMRASGISRSQLLEGIARRERHRSTRSRPSPRLASPTRIAEKL